MSASRRGVHVLVAPTVAAALALGACGSGGASMTTPSTGVAPTTSTTLPPSPSPSPDARTTTVPRPVPTTGLYVAPSSAITVARTTTTTAPWSGTPATMAQLVDGLARRLATFDGVVHLIEVRTWEGSVAATATTETWIDGSAQLARSMWTSGDESRASVLLDGVSYSWPSGMPNRPAMELPSCLGAPAIVRVVVDCPTGQLTGPATVERETVDGHDVITFVSRQIIEPREVDLRESFDAATLLPVRAVEVSTSESEPFRSTTTWQSDVVARASLADGFFTPEAIGVVFPTTDEVMSAIPATVPVYWLGETYAWPAGTLVVNSAEWSGTVSMVAYGSSDRRYAMPPALRVDTSPAEPDPVPASSAPSCPGVPTGRIGAATAVFRCPGEPAGRLILELGFPDAVVRIESPYRCDGDVCTLGRLNDADTLLALARSVVRR